MNYVLATSRPWNEILALRLKEKTGHTFHLITRKDELNLRSLQEINPRYIFFPHWSYFVPEEIFNPFECVIFHMTDLPYGRGGSPLQNLVLRGHKETKITALRCVKEIDAGPVYMKKPLCLEGAASEIFLRAAVTIEDMIEEIVREEPSPVPQEGESVFFQRRKPEESNLAQAPVQNLNDFFDFIRVLDAEGYPRAFLDVHDHRIELSRVQMEQDKLVGTFVIYKQNNIPRGGVKTLIDRCYPKPPRDVYDRMLEAYKPGDPFYTLECKGQIIGMVYCSKHSKGGHLENLAIDPEYQKYGLGGLLVGTLIEDNPGVITLTTRIPEYFTPYAFEKCGKLPDGSTCMYLITSTYTS